MDVVVEVDDVVADDVAVVEEVVEVVEVAGIVDEKVVTLSQETKNNVKTINNINFFFIIILPVEKQVVMKGYLDYLESIYKKSSILAMKFDRMLTN